MRVFLESLPICVCSSFRFEFQGGIWDHLIVLIPDHCLYFYSAYQKPKHNESVKLVLYHNRNKYNKRLNEPEPLT